MLQHVEHTENDISIFLYDKLYLRAPKMVVSVIAAARNQNNRKGNEEN